MFFLRISKYSLLILPYFEVQFVDITGSKSVLYEISKARFNKHA